jgi:5-methylcytosine-specific restriction endonuclease McrA
MSITKLQAENATKYKKKAIPKALKKMVWDKYIGDNVGKTKCMCCRHQEIRQIEFHCGHVIAEAKNGKTVVENLRPICAQCNLSMGKMNMNEFIKKYMSNKN